MTCFSKILGQSWKVKFHNVKLLKFKTLNFDLKFCWNRSFFHYEKIMRFKKWPQLPGAGRTRAGHHHGSHTPTSPKGVLLGKMAHHTKQIRRQCKRNAKSKTLWKSFTRQDLIKMYLSAVSAGSGNIVARNSLGGITFTIDTLDSEPKRKVFKSWKWNILQQLYRAKSFLFFCFFALHWRAFVRSENNNLALYNVYILVMSKIKKNGFKLPMPLYNFNV